MAKKLCEVHKYIVVLIIHFNLYVSHKQYKGALKCPLMYLDTHGIKFLNFKNNFNFKTIFE